MQFIITLVVLGIVWWLTTLLPLPPPIPVIIQVAVILVIIWEILALTGKVPSTMSWRKKSE